MTDLRSTIAVKSDQLNADDLLDAPRTIRITKVYANPGSPDQPIAVSFEGDDGKPYLPCKIMRRVLVHLWGDNGNAFIGRSLTLYRDDKVRFGGLEVGGIRISHASHIDEDVTMALTITRANRKPFTVKPLIEPKSVDTPKRTRGQWLDGLEITLRDAVNGPNPAEAVDRIICGEEVMRAKAEFRNGHIERLNRLITDALVAVTPPPLPSLEEAAETMKTNPWPDDVEEP